MTRYEYNMVCLPTPVRVQERRHKKAHPRYARRHLLHNPSRCSHSRTRVRRTNFDSLPWFFYAASDYAALLSLEEPLLVIVGEFPVAH